MTIADELLADAGMEARVLVIDDVPKRPTDWALPQNRQKYVEMQAALDAGRTVELHHRDATIALWAAERIANERMREL